jgi:hypothetical protein
MVPENTCGHNHLANKYMCWPKVRENAIARELKKNKKTIVREEILPYCFLFKNTVNT